MDYLISCIIGYLLGSFPTAYLILKKIKGIDITTKGSGNVGAMNSYEVTNSKKFGIFVLIVDLLKGLLSVIVVLVIIRSSFTLASLSLLFSIFSHCFNPWINFKGGRGLATAAGGLLILFPAMVLTWIILYVFTYLIKKDILISNIAATILSLVFVFLGNQELIKFAYPKPVGVNELLLFSSAGLLIIFIKHIEPLKDILSKNNK
jgi:glycerol-3-phosphate acyltransferase PlsY